MDPLTKEQRTTLLTFTGNPLDVQIDSDGDLCFEWDDGTRYLYLRADQVSSLREFINKVLP